MLFESLAIASFVSSVGFGILGGCLDRAVGLLSLPFLFASGMFSAVIIDRQRIDNSSKI